MNDKFGFLSKLEFLQSWASNFIAGMNPAAIHNIEKYYILKKVFYLSAIEDIEGDYLEFGVYTGSSFSHAIRCCKKSAFLNKGILNTGFFGFDSFEGFGELSKDDKHPFYVDNNFATDYDAVNARVKKVAEDINYKLIKGFFDQTCAFTPSYYGIKKARAIFIDSDTYSSSNDALTFTIPTIQEGTFIILDDFYSYRGSEEKGVAKAFDEFLKKGNFSARQVFTYGMGGCVYVISKIDA